jgi:hypothetical protein
MARNYCFTINNYTDDDIDCLGNLQCRYMVFGMEVGAEGTPHLQGYLEMSKVVKFETMKKLLPRAHIEARKGPREKARDYCMKDGIYNEKGEWAIQGRRTDLDACRLLADDEGMRAVAATCSLQGIKVAQYHLTYNEVPRDWVPSVHWLWGASGAGKSKKARELTGDDDVYTKSESSKWWDGYDAHTNVIIDDYRNDWWEFTELLSLLDRYEKRIEYKGGWRQFKARMIVITSLYSPEQMYGGGREPLEQLVRRVTEVTEVVREIGVILLPNL